MAVLVIGRVPNNGEEERKQWRARNKVLSQQPGFLFQGDGPNEDGWLVVSAWQSRHDFDSYFREHVQPYLPKGVDIPPPEIHELESTVTRYVGKET